MIVASIDIGTNTVLLLIAKVDTINQTVEPLYEEQRMPRLGKGLKKDGLINDEKIELLDRILQDYLETIQYYKCDKVIATGTNALRIAKNSDEILKRIDVRFGIVIDVITGDKEAELAYRGATNSIKNFNSAMVIDIGGGSTEIIFGDRNGITSKKSFPLGSVSVTENNLQHHPPTIDEITKLRDELVIKFNKLKENAVRELTIGIAGTVTTIACMIKGLKNFDSSIIEGTVITSNELEKLIERLQKMKPIEILAEFGDVLNGREDIITGGAIILSEIIKLSKTYDLIVSSRGIRYGAIVDALF